jgi:hypothetical protein
MYPAYRKKTDHVDTFAERVRGCFMYSMNGKAPDDGHDILVALESYAYWMAQKAPRARSCPVQVSRKRASPKRLPPMKPVPRFMKPSARYATPQTARASLSAMWPCSRRCGARTL